MKKMIVSGWEEQGETKKGGGGGEREMIILKSESKPDERKGKK